MVGLSSARMELWTGGGIESLKCNECGQLVQLKLWKTSHEMTKTTYGCDGVSAHIQILSVA